MADDRQGSIVSAQSRDWGYKTSSVYIRKVRFRDRDGPRFQGRIHGNTFHFATPGSGCLLAAAYVEWSSRTRDQERV